MLRDIQMSRGDWTYYQAPVPYHLGMAGCTIPDMDRQARFEVSVAGGLHEMWFPMLDEARPWSSLAAEASIWWTHSPPEAVIAATPGARRVYLLRDHESWSESWERATGSRGNPDAWETYAKQACLADPDDMAILHYSDLVESPEGYAQMLEQAVYGEVTEASEHAARWTQGAVAERAPGHVTLPVLTADR